MERLWIDEIQRLSQDLDLWARAAARGHEWADVQLSTLTLLRRVEERLHQRGFHQKAREVSNLQQRLAAAVPDFSGAQMLIHDLAKMALHARIDLAA
jgi:hypothetical protein